MPASRSAGSIAGVNDASACQVAFTVAGESHTPSAMPARNAAPSAVVSWTAARRTGTPRRSAWNWQSRSITDAPPSIRISDGAVPLAFVIASTTSAVWNAIDSTTARAMCAFPVPRVMPTIVPRAYGSHHGEPSPVNAGTTYTPPLSGTHAASGPVSLASVMMPSPSRSHWIAAPVTKIAPSIA